MNRFAVIGLGRFGKKLAIALSMSGAEVVAIDRERTVIEDIADQVSHAVRLDRPMPMPSCLRHQQMDVVIVGMGERAAPSSRPF
jgi:trk system potassium uptake protein TrkA